MYCACGLALCGLFVGGGSTEKPAPLPPREELEWCRITSYDGTKTDLPRVLLIGGSITGQYAPVVREGVKGRAYLSVLATSKAVGDPALLDEIATILNQYAYAVVHFNVGLHVGGGHEAYRKGFPDLLATIRKHAPGAKLIWATSTPCWKRAAKTQMAREFNEIAAEFVEKEGIVVNDLHGLVMSHAGNPEAIWDEDGVHYTKEGANLQGKQAAESILAVMEARS